MSGELRDVYTSGLAWRQLLDDGPCVPINCRKASIKSTEVIYADGRYPQKCLLYGSTDQYMCATNRDDLVNMMIERLKAEQVFEGSNDKRIKNLQDGIANE